MFFVFFKLLLSFCLLLGEENTPLTEEEIQEKIEKAFASLSSMISLWGSFNVRDRTLDREPYTKEFRDFALNLSKSYFHFKIGGRIPYTYIYEFRCRVGRYLADKKYVEGLCDVTSEGLDKRDFCTESLNSDLKFYLPLKNCVLTLLNYSDASKEVRLSLGAHKQVFTSMAKLIKDWGEPHLKKELSVSMHEITHSNILINFPAINYFSKFYKVLSF